MYIESDYPKLPTPLQAYPVLPHSVLQISVHFEEDVSIVGTKSLVFPINICLSLLLSS